MIRKRTLSHNSVRYNASARYVYAVLYLVKRLFRLIRSVCRLLSEAFELYFIDINSSSGDYKSDDIFKGNGYKI